MRGLACWRLQQFLAKAFLLEGSPQSSKCERCCTWNVLTSSLQCPLNLVVSRATSSRFRGYNYFVLTRSCEANMVKRVVGTREEKGGEEFEGMFVNMVGKGMLDTSALRN